MGTPQAAACVPASPRQAAHGRTTTGASPGIRKPGPSPLPQHIRQRRGRIRLAGGGQGGFAAKPSAAAHRLPGRAQWRMTRPHSLPLGAALAGRGSKPVAAHTCSFPSVDRRRAPRTQRAFGGGAMIPFRLVAAQFRFPMSRTDPRRRARQGSSPAAQSIPACRSPSSPPPKPAPKRWPSASAAAEPAARRVADGGPLTLAAARRSRARALRDRRLPDAVPPT